MSRDRLRDEYESNQDALGVTEERQEFFDDANSVLGIGYSATMEAGRSKRILREIDERDDEAAKALKKKLEVDPGAGETVNRGAADDYAALRNAGYDHETAMAMTANNEYEVQGDHSSYTEYRDKRLGASPEALMSAPDAYRHSKVQMKPGAVRCRARGCGEVFDADEIACPACGLEVKQYKLGHGKRKTIGNCVNCKSPVVTGVVVCQSCGSEVAPLVSRGGRPRNPNKKVDVPAKASPSDIAVIRSHGLKLSGVVAKQLAKVAECLRTGQKWD